MRTPAPARRLLVAAATALLLGAVSFPLGGSAAGAASACGKAAGTKAGGGHSMHGTHGMRTPKRSGGATTPCPTVAGARTIPVTASGFAFSPTAITIGAGEDVTIALTADDLTHDFEVQGVGHVVHAKKGRTAVGGLRIATPGTYRFWCTVPGHRRSGMVGTITVT